MRKNISEFKYTLFLFFELNIFLICSILFNLIYDITIPTSVYNCVLTPTIISMQFIKLKNIFKIYIEILLDIKIQSLSFQGTSLLICIFFKFNYIFDIKRSLRFL